MVATARVFLALASLAAISLDPTQPSRHATLAYSLLVVYALYSILILCLVHILRGATPIFTWSVHAVDVFWPALISFFTEGPSSPFFPFFVFVLVAAAYRWGWSATMATTAASILLLTIEAWLMGFGRPTIHHYLEGEFELNRFIMRIAYLLMLGLIVGYMGEQERQRQLEARVLGKVMARVQAQTGMRAVLKAIFEDILDVAGARHILLALEEDSGEHLYLWEDHRVAENGEPGLRFLEAESSDRPRYFFVPPGEAWFATQPRAGADAGNVEVLVVGRDGENFQNVAGNSAFPKEFLAAFHFDSIIVLAFTYQPKWSGTLFVFEPRLGPSRKAKLRFIQLLVQQLIPVVHNTYLIRRLRSRVVAADRARIARELHDEVIQSLIGCEIQVEVLRKRMLNESAGIAEDLSVIRHLILQQVANLRELMQQMKPLELGPRQLLEFLANTVDRFRRETGIAANFLSDLDEVVLPPRVCREVARIVQEGLANVRKHSGAKNVLVQFGFQKGNWKLIIEDDGHGFEFSGRQTMSELEAAQKGPQVIKERVRTIGGEMTIESSQGRRARLEITIPQALYG